MYRLTRSSMASGLRWAFNFQAWQPTKEEWILAGRCVQPEEKTRISKFVFRRDAKSAMAGRLLMRKAISDTLNIPFEKVELARTEKGKPYLVNEQSVLPHFSFNVSHQGDLAVLAAEPIHPVGIDVMKVEMPRGKRTADDYIDTFKKQFTPQEWETIKFNVDDWEQLQTFYRLWCLKESYVKVLGTGLGFTVSRLDFHLNTDLAEGVYVKDTKVFVDKKREPNWLFEETLLSNKHCVAVALQKRDDHPLPQSSPAFQMLSFTELTSGVQPLSEPDDTYWQNFAAKQEKPKGASS